MSMRTCLCHVFGLRTSRNPKNRQTSHCRYAWGQSRSMTSDDLRKVKMECQRSSMVCWPKSCMIYPFLLMAASYVAETRFPWKIGRRLYLLWRHSSMAWPDPVIFLPKAAQRMLHKLCKILAQSAQRFESHFRKKLMGGRIDPPARATVKYTWYTVQIRWIRFVFTQNTFYTYEKMSKTHLLIGRLFLIRLSWPERNAQYRCRVARKWISQREMG